MELSVYFFLLTIVARLWHNVSATTTMLRSSSFSSGTIQRMSTAATSVLLPGMSSSGSLKIPPDCKGGTSSQVCSGHGVCQGLEEYQTDSTIKGLCQCGPGPKTVGMEGGWTGKYCEVDVRRNVRVSFPCAHMPIAYINKAKEVIPKFCSPYQLIWKVRVCGLCFA